MTAALLRLADRVSSAIGWLAARLVVAMVAAGALGAVLRYLSRPLGIAPALNALADIQWMLFSAVFLLGAAWALAEDTHVRVDVLYGRLSPHGRAWIDLLGSLLLLLPFCALLLWTTWPAVVESVVLREAALDPGGLARWPIKLVVPVAVVLLALQGIVEAVKAALVLTEPESPADA